MAYKVLLQLGTVI